MSTITLFAIIFVFILIVGGWITSEFISHKHSSSNKHLRTNMAKLERENNVLQQQLNKQSGEFSQLKEDYDKIKGAKKQIRMLESEYKSLNNRYSNFNRGIDVLRKTVTSKKYMHNSLAKEIIMLLNEHLPDDKQIELKKTEISQKTFKRIKDSM